jgi:hypothetical protein
MSEWIHIKDKFPPIDQDVLVFNKGRVEINCRMDENYPDDPDLRNQIVWSEQGIYNEIEWWMPLPPEPPK